MDINIPEILVANGAGCVMVVFLLLFRVRQRQAKQPHERMFNIMLFSILAALIGETISYCVDGRDFFGCHALQYATNFICLSQAVVMGFLWCLFVDYRIFCSMKRLKSKARVLLVPLALIVAMLLGDLLGNGLIFQVDEANRYQRGKLNIILYAALCIYFVESIVNVRRAHRKGSIPFFFPVYSFAITCMAGVVVQGFFYGLSAGWLSASMAAVFVYLELQTANSYMDSISGLFNRRYANYHLSHAMRTGERLHGIMLDINDFKSINDAHGHAVGDRAIQAMGKILSKSLLPNAVAMRMGGDEFVVMLSDSSDAQCQVQIDIIEKSIEEFNQSSNEKFHLSASMGSAGFDGHNVEEFLAQMDFTMYEFKREYHRHKH